MLGKLDKVLTIAQCYVGDDMSIFKLNQRRITFRSTLLFFFAISLAACNPILRTVPSSPAPPLAPQIAQSVALATATATIATTTTSSAIPAGVFTAEIKPNEDKDGKLKLATGEWQLRCLLYTSDAADE